MFIENEDVFMNIKRIVFASLFCIVVLLCVEKKADAAFPYDIEQKPVTATSIQDGKVTVYKDENLKNKKEEIMGNNLTIEAYKVSKNSIYGNYKSGKNTGAGWFSLSTFVVNPKYKNVYATVRDGMHIYTNRSFSKVQTTIKKYSGIIVISKVDGDRQVICDKNDHYEIGWMTAGAFSNTLLYDGREKQILSDGIYKFRCGYQDDKNGGSKKQITMESYPEYTFKIMHTTKNQYYIQNVQTEKYLAVIFKKADKKAEKGKTGKYTICWTEHPDKTYGLFQLQRLNGAFSIQNVKSKYFLAQPAVGEAATNSGDTQATTSEKNSTKTEDTNNGGETQIDTSSENAQQKDNFETAFTLEKSRSTQETHWRIHAVQKMSNSKKPFVFTQYDPEWCAIPYGGGGCMGTAGCGILATVNAVYALGGQYMDVMELANYAVEKNYRIVGSGTDDGIFKAAAKKYGQKYGFAWDGASGSIDVLKKKLKAGDTAIVHVQGHYVSISDYNKKTKKYLLLDSNYLPKRATSAFGDWIGVNRLLSGALESQYFYFFKSSEL